MASASTPPLTPAYSQCRRPSRRQCGASGHSAASRSSVTKGSRRRRSCEIIQPNERSCSRRKGCSRKCGGCVWAASSTLLRIENSPMAAAPAGLPLASGPRPPPAASSTRQEKRAAGMAEPRRSIRASRTPGRRSTRTSPRVGCSCTTQGSISARRAFSRASARRLRCGCHSCAEEGTRSRRCGATGAKTECSCRREAKRQRVPSAPLRPVTSSHCGGSCAQMAWPEANNGAEATRRINVLSMPPKDTSSDSTALSRPSSPAPTRATKGAARPVSGTS
mmetsp:Transcript_74846/g.241990  ORF Transcript_74846/g.241990 Transcript_74846/m.241990 type:complete len:278 (-) Transcript_74846:423-1256(-)